MKNRKVKTLLSLYRKLDDIRGQLALELRLIEAKELWKAMRIISRVVAQLDERSKD